MNDDAYEATYQATLNLLEELRRNKANECVELAAPGAKRSQRGRARPALRFPKLSKSRKPQTRRLLQAHTNKVMDCCWGERDTMVSCARDGTVHVWDVKEATRALSWKTPGSWTMTCCLDGGVVAVGGLDNLCSIYVLPDEYEEALRAPSQSNSVSAAAASTPATSAASVESPTPPSGDSQPEEGEYALQADVTLEGHEGYVSCVRFLQSGDVVTGSGDASCGLWDAAHGVLKQRFSDHSGDVCHVAVNPEAPTVFASVSLDATAKVWDTRVGGNGRGSTPIPTGGGGGGFGSSLRGGGGSSSNANVSSVSTNSGGGGGGGSSSQPVITFEGHLAEVNACHFLPGGTSLATGSDDATCRVFDLRCRGELRCFHDDAVSSGVSSLTATRSGRIVFGGYDDAFVRGWDLFGFESSSLAAAGNGGGGWGGNGDGSSTCAWTLDGHISRVSCLAASRDGAAVASGSWDGDLRIWA